MCYGVLCERVSIECPFSVCFIMLLSSVMSIDMLECCSSVLCHRVMSACCVECYVISLVESAWFIVLRYGVIAECYCIVYCYSVML